MSEELERITTDDSRYTEVLTAWILNGRTRQFDMEGAFGGRLIVVEPGIVPIFHVKASAPTTLYDSDDEDPSRDGYESLMSKAHMLELDTDKSGKLLVTVTPYPRTSV